MHETVDPSVAHYITALDFIFMSLFRKIQYLYFISVSECHSQCLVQLLSSTSKHFETLSYQINRYCVRGEHYRPGISTENIPFKMSILVFVIKILLIS